MKEIILSKGVLDVAHESASELARTNQEAFALLRRSGFGASDSSKVIGISPFTTPKELIEEKLLTRYTDAERTILEKDTVRMGIELEPLVLSKFADKFGVLVHKPEQMFRFKEHPQLTVNYDGVLALGSELLVPVEAKVVSQWGMKYFNLSKTIDTMYTTQNSITLSPGFGVTKHCELMSEYCGIPSYYYTQLQQEMMGLDAPFCYLAALFVKGWDFRVFKIEKDAYVQDMICNQSKEMWEIIQERKAHI